MFKFGKNITYKFQLLCGIFYPKFVDTDDEIETSNILHGDYKITENEGSLFFRSQ